MWVVVSTHTRSLAFISAGLKTRDNLLKKLITQSPGHDSRRKRTYLSPEWLCICDLVCQLNVWSSGHHQMHQQGGHSWGIPRLIYRGGGGETSIMLKFKQKRLYLMCTIEIMKFTYFNEDGYLLWSIFWNIFLVLWNLTKAKERFVTRSIHWD